jgi:hypothetical protein
MFERDLLLSAMVDQAIAGELMPWPCPCDFGPDDRYRLEELVGAGGLGLVYRATDRHLSSEGFDAQVAIKILKLRPSLRSEALAARRIAHPHVLSVIDRGECPDGTCYIVSEYVGGGSLSDLEPPLKPKEAAALIVKLAGAVQAAHSAGIVHCDLKPSNVLLTAEGEPKLCDFGLSRWQGDEPGAARGNTAFMSPEQFLGGEDALTPPSDIYALGGMLYFLLTGKLPHGDSGADVAAFHLKQEPVPAPGVEHDLDAICLRATARDRAQRHHSAGELADDLQRWLRREPITWTRPSLLRRGFLSIRRRPIRAAALMMFLMAAGAAVGVWRYNVDRDRVRTIEAQRTAVRLANEQVEETKARVRRHIESLASHWFGGPGGDPNDSLLTPLVWIEWIGGAPVLQEDGKFPAAEERATMLRAYIQATSRDGDRRLDSCLARYTLAQSLLATGEVEESAQLISDLQRTLVPNLAPDDPLRTAIDALHACNRYLAADSGALPAAARELDLVQQRLDRRTGVNSVFRLVDTVRNRRVAPRGQGR